MKSFTKYWFIFITQIGNTLAYPAELLGRGLIILPFMWIFYQLWHVTFLSSNIEILNGLTLRDTIWYLMMAETIELSRPRLGNAISEAVKDGSIAYFLNKPYNFILYHYSSSMGETIIRALLNILLGGGMVWWLVGPPPTAAGWPLVIIAALGAWTLNFCIATMIGLTSFIVEDISAFQWIYQKLAFIFGGLLIPLDFYPHWLQVVSSALPFSSITYAPARLFVTPSLTTFAAVLGSQLAWVLVLGILLALVYQRGISHITINGG